MDFTVGGERISLTPEQIEEAMNGVAPEAHQKYVVELLGELYPPKQVFARVTGRDRQTFTTQEAQRVLKRLGFLCREAHKAAVSAGSDGPELSHVENALATVQLAIAQLERRVAALEAERAA